MKKILAALLGSCFVFLNSAESFAANSNALFAGYNSGQNTSYSYLVGVKALNGDIEKDGLRLRVGGGYGRYSYTKTSVVGNSVTGQVSSGDLMTGYQKGFDIGHVTAYLGVNHDNYRLNREDPLNTVVGGKSGIKGQFEFLLNPFERVVVQNITNYTSAYHAYWSQTYLGWDFCKFVFGPEASFLGSRSFTQQRFGAKFSRVNIGPFESYLSGGYMKSSGFSGSDGAYTEIGLATKF
jgi:hypothetical protein